MELINVVLVCVFSIALLGLMYGLIFKPEFRNDILRTDKDNEAKFLGLTLKGGLFFTLFGLIIGGFVYFVLELNKNHTTSGNSHSTSYRLPRISSNNNVNWIAIDTDSGKQVKLYYNLKDSVKEIPQAKLSALNFGLVAELDSASSDVVIRTRKGNLKLGSLNANDLNKFRAARNVDIQVEPFDIKYNLTLSPFSAKEVISESFDWQMLKRLPFTIKVKFTPTDGMYISMEGEHLPESTYTIKKDFRTVLYHNDNAYLIWSISSVTSSETGDNHVHLRIAEIQMPCSL